MDRLFDAAFPALNSLQRGGLFAQQPGDFPVDLYLGKDNLTVRAELPGFRKEDVSVEIEDEVLTVTAHQKSEAQPEQEKGATPEFRVTRAISLPENLDHEKVQAAYQNGVLTVTLGKREEVKPKQIAIEVK
jgi:HSP20 family protein